MRHFNQLLFIFCISSFSIMAQSIQFKEHVFISGNQDSVPAELGTFQVPENRAKPDGKQLSISFVRFKSTNPNPAAPIVYLAGGPGGSGINTAKGGRFELFMKLRSVADVIALDQRGTGLSNEIPNCTCQQSLTLEKPTLKEEYLEQSLACIKDCMAFWEKEGHDIKAYNTTENAKDIDDLRRALGVEKISLWGISYGSHLSFEYIRLFENHLDKVVIASLEGPDETIKLPSNTQAFVDMICEAAADNYGNNPKYPNLKEVIKTVHDRVKAEPVVATIKNRMGGTNKVGISHYELQMAVAAFYLRDPSDSKKIPKVYTEMFNGDFSSVAQNVLVIKQFYFRQLRAMSFAMDMNSGISEKRKKQILKEIPQTTFGGTLNPLMLSWMTESGFGQLPDEFRKLKKNNVNALLLNGSMDGRTYLSAGQQTAKAFKNGKHVTIENAGHNLYMVSPKVVNLVVDFFSGKTVAVDKITIPITPFE